MKIEEILKAEFDQQYEQYRWIGKQQTLVFTFYSAIIAATFALMGGFIKNDPGNESIKILFPYVLVLLGLVGVLIAFVIVKSRSQQFRTAILLNELVVEMEKLSEKPILPPTSPIPPSALRYRLLIGAGGGRFIPRNTMSIVTSLAFIFGISLICVPIVYFLIVPTCIVVYINAPLLWLISVFIISCFGVFLILPKFQKMENNRARRDYDRAKNLTINWPDEIRRSNFGI